MAIVNVLKDPEALAVAAAERITSQIEVSMAVRHGASVCLAGGHTPRRIYELLADDSRPWRARIDWAQLHVFWGDERHVPPDSDESNFGMAYRVLLAHVPLPANQLHRIRGELPDPAQAAREYDMTLRKATLPFDVMLLGIGEDAHVASLFPASPLLVLDSTSGMGDIPPATQLVAAVWVDYLDTWRMTLTPPTLLDSRAIVVVVAGSNKAAAVHAALDGPEDMARWPAQLLRAAGDRVEWFMDAAARSLGAPSS